MWWGVAPAVCALLLSEYRHYRPGIWLFKPLASTGFVLAGVQAGAMATPEGRLLLAGLCLSWLGDVLLIPRGSKKIFLAGVLFFLGAHVAYGAGFVLRGVQPVATVLGTLPFLGVGAWVHQRAKKGVPEMLQKAVIAYIIVISIMVGLATGAVAAGAPPLALVAAIAFAISDISVAIDRFISPGFVNRLWGLPLYYGAQLLFVAALL
ncbi:MAG TPA: lysoplasmalogenase [Myxococcota bacterium]|nr:lysoplasmalogenase [Myxococcota bacterium]